MKILYFYAEASSNMSQWQHVHFLDELFRHNCTVQIFNPLLYSSAVEANEVLVNTIKKSNFDLFFSEICNCKLLFEESLREINKVGVPSLCIRFDNLVVPFNDKNLSRYFDLVWLTSKETKYLYDRWGVNSLFAPYAANPFTFTYNKTKTIKEVAFIGTPYGSRSLMINHLTTNQIPVALFYGGNQKKSIATIKHQFQNPQPNPYKVVFDRLRFYEGRKVMVGSLINKVVGRTKLDNNAFLHRFDAIHPSEISTYYSKYNLCLASTSTNHTDILSSPLNIINLRNFEIPMSGGIELCRYNPELAEYFEEDKEIIMYRSKDEMIDKARYYLSDNKTDEIYRIQQAARTRAASEHTWWCRFSLMFKALGLSY